MNAPRVAFKFLSILVVLCSLGGRRVAQSDVTDNKLLPSTLRESPWALTHRLRREPGGAIEQQEDLQTDDLPALYGRYASIAYQSWVDDNWELYMAEGDGNDPARLTTRDGDDESPSLGRGCDLIAFNTTRNGNEDIYTMKADGSNQSRLTLDLARDVLPTLSPDRARVAFQSYRDAAEPDIYVINVADRSVSRLTEYAGYDGQPNWSADGQSIAFISDRSGYKNVWTMTTEGTDLQQVTNLYHAAAPKWSPDGTEIAFATDDQGTGFTSLWVVELSSGEIELIRRPTESDTDAWPGAWSFDGTYILYEEATWDYDDGWYIVTSHLDVVHREQPDKRHRLLEGGIHMAGSWAPCDIAPPSSRVNPLPPTSVSPVHVTWSGSDDFDSDLEYHLQYRVENTTEWIDWEVAPDSTWTSQTEEDFFWEGTGATVHFRCRARDEPGNVEPWPADPGDTRTTLPFQLGGEVRDAREVSLVDARIQGPPPLGSTTYSDSNGRYALPTAKGGDNAYHVQAQGYSPQLATRAVLAQELELDFYLLPGPDFVANGGFEDGQAGWYAGQGLTFTQGDKGFGQGFVRFGGNLVPLPQSSAWVTLWQDLEIPESSHEPTLSLLYALGDGDGDPVGALQVIVSDEQREEVLATLNEATPWVIADENAHYPMWQHYHADLGEWAGRPITLKLRYDSGWTDSYALLDQVSIAPWLTPLVQEVTPKESTNETSLALTVEGTNFVAAPDSGTGPHVILGSRALDTTYVSDSVLQATVPAGFPPDLYDVWVRNPGGQRAVLDEGFALHSALMLPLVQKRFSLDTR